MRIGIDLGGSKIEGVVLDRAGEVVARRRIATPRDDYAMTLAAVVDLVRALENDADAREARVGVAIPGAISPATGLVKNANSSCLIGHAFDRDLSQRLERPVRMANDANCFVLSEAADGAAAGADCVFGVILGTGVGGGVVLGGRLHAGANLIAGEWGHNPLPWPEPAEQPGPPCYCGRSGCIEVFVSGPGLEADHARVSGETRSAPEIAAAAAAGEPGAEATLERHARRLAKALASVINILDPEVVVCGGGLSNLDRIYQRVPALWAPFIFSDVVTTRLLKARHGDSSGVRGAAWLWSEADAT